VRQLLKIIPLNFFFGGNEEIANVIKMSAIKKSALQFFNLFIAPEIISEFGTDYFFL